MHGYVTQLCTRKLSIVAMLMIIIAMYITAVHTIAAMYIIAMHTIAIALVHKMYVSDGYVYSSSPQHTRRAQGLHQDSSRIAMSASN